ncbi:MAG TPA: nicotinate-nucleotide--dimethylbenzimidazole phosphoribosyltransferase [Ktedonobacterales bacterium]|nr:nicotinate-nucleotide--dimethylbenzimidazole phosphoribosyltransferase [Ktedonobacterales bacterium]
MYGPLRPDIAAIIAAISLLDTTAMAAARMRQEQLTKPAGSLGRLESLAIQIAGIVGQEQPALDNKAIVVMAGDHGVTAEGVSAYPAEVTPQMALNFLRGGAAINALAGVVGARVVVVDIGVASPLEHPGLLSRKVAPGTANMAQGPAMAREQAEEAIATGIAVVDSLAREGVQIVATGEMGIGNTTAASAITAVLTSSTPAGVTGRGTGIDDAQLAHKIAVIERALAVNAPHRDDGLDVLAKVGGLEIAGLVGVILGGAAHHMPIVLDGFIAGSAALVAEKLCPQVRDYLIAGHISVERGHHVLLEALGLLPLLDLALRLGEGTGAALAMGIIDGALAAHRQMATFAEAGVSEREESEHQG